jgi:hypothetical protein
MLPRRAISDWRVAGKTEAERWTATQINKPTLSINIRKSSRLLVNPANQIPYTFIVVTGQLEEGFNRVKEQLQAGSGFAFPLTTCMDV